MLKASGNPAWAPGDLITAAKLAAIEAALRAWQDLAGNSLPAAGERGRTVLKNHYYIGPQLYLDDGTAWRRVPVCDTAGKLWIEDDCYLERGGGAVLSLVNTYSGVWLCGVAPNQLLTNATFDGANFNRMDTGMPAYRCVFGSTSFIDDVVDSIQVYTAPAGANPITWAGPFRVLWEGSSLVRSKEIRAGGFMDAAGNYQTAVAGATVTFADGTATIVTSTTTGNLGRIYRKYGPPASSTGFTWDKRRSISFGANFLTADAAAECYLVTGDLAAATPKYVGFKQKGLDLYGVVHNGTAEVEFLLIAGIAGVHTLACTLVPGKQATWWVDDVLKKTDNTPANLPTGTDSANCVMQVRAKTTGTVAVSLAVGEWRFAQHQ